MNWLQWAEDHILNDKDFTWWRQPHVQSELFPRAAYYRETHQRTRKVFRCSICDHVHLSRDEVDHDSQVCWWCAHMRDDDPGI